MTPARRVALIVAAGLLTGVATQLGQGALPEGAGQIANAISPWLLVAFLVGSAMPDRRWAVAAGIGVLALALAGYYGMVQLRFGYGGATQSWLFWGLAALVGGSVFGVAGHTWRTGEPRWRAAAIGLMAAVFIAEGVYLTRILPQVAIGAGFMVGGSLVPLVLGRTSRDRVAGYVAIAPALVLGAVGYVVFLAIYDLTSGIA